MPSEREAALCLAEYEEPRDGERGEDEYKDEQIPEQ
jgi:hypothetical protein